MNDRLLTANEAADRLGISRRWLNELARVGGGPERIQFGPRCVRYSLTDLDAWVAAHRKGDDQ